jgi:soluble cytochrome b562
MNANRKLTPQIVDELATLIRNGNYVRHACKYVNVSNERFYEWKKIGHQAKEKLENNQEITDFEECCVDLVNKIEAAESEAIMRNVQNIQTAAKDKKHWTASAWWLERTQPKYFAQNQTITHVSEKQQLSAEEIKESLERTRLQKLKAEAIELEESVPETKQIEEDTTD